MPERTAINYCYDGSFDGFLCCVFESYEKNEMPYDVLSEGAALPLLLPVKAIETDKMKALRVWASVPKKMGSETQDFLRKAFLTCDSKRELLMLKFMRLGYTVGPSVMGCLTDNTVCELSKAVRHLEYEVHKYAGFLRFSESKGVLTAQIEPKNIVLPFLADHFCERFFNERFLIYDKTHGMALLHQNKKFTICDVEEMELPNPDEEEIKFRSLWRMFYDTIEIKERHNPRCRMTHMPKRFWNCMTEFSREVRPAQGKASMLPEIPAQILSDVQ